MFRWKELTLHGWDLWDEVAVPLEGDVTIVTGENGSGKTTLIDSLRQLLNARTLSKKRRVQDYMKDPKRGVLIRGLVEQQPVDGEMPFRTEGVDSSEVTLACTLRPEGGGAPQKRFLIEEGELSPEQITKLTTSGGDWLPPEEYRRALRNAGISKSLMNVLTLSQGSIEDLSQRSPSDLFNEVLDVLGDKEIIERYEDARENLRNADERVAEHRRTLHHRRGELDQKRERLRVLEDYEEARDDLQNLQDRLEAAKLQECYEKLDKFKENHSEAREERKKAVRERDQNRSELEENEEQREALEEEKGERRTAWETAKEDYDEIHGSVSQIEGRIEELREKEAELEELPNTPVDVARQRLEEASTDQAQVSSELEELNDELEALKEQRDQLEDGVPVYPEPVQATITALEEEGIGYQIVAGTLELAESNRSEAVESALGDLRFGLLVSGENEDKTLEFAETHGFPAPVFAGPSVNPGSHGPLELGEAAPAWMETELSDIDFEGEGLWADEHGTWVRPSDDRFIGEDAIREKLEATEQRIEELTDEQTDVQERLEEALQDRDEALDHLNRCQRREELQEQVQGLSQLEDDLVDARGRLKDAREEKEARHEVLQRVTSKITRLEATNEQLEEELESLESRANELDETTTELSSRIQAMEEEIDQLEDDVRPDLRPEAKDGELNSRSWLREKVADARERVNGFEDVPDPQIRNEVAALENSLQEVQEHLDQSTKVKENAEERVQQAKKNFLRNVSRTLQRLRQRIQRYARMAGVTSDVELPPLKDPDIDLLEEGELRVKFGFDDKDPVLMRDPSFSGGQKVIAGLILLMAMADVEGPSFFIIDEPFAHLSVDRIDEVAEFMQTTDSQFIITVPTGLAQQDLAPGTQLIRLRKKDADEPYAPDPLIVVS